MSADGSHRYDQEGSQPLPVEETADGLLDLGWSLVDLLRALASRDKAGAVRVARRIVARLQDFIDAHSGAGAPTTSPATDSEPAEKSEGTAVTLVDGIGPTADCQSAPLFFDTLVAKCLYHKRGSLERRVAHLIILRWIDLLKGSPIPRDELIEYLKQIVTISNTKSFKLNFTQLKKEQFITWGEDETGNKHNPDITITKKGHTHCLQLIERTVRRLPHNRHNVLMSHLPWLGLKPIQDAAP